MKFILTNTTPLKTTIIIVAVFTLLSIQDSSINRCGGEFNIGFPQPVYFYKSGKMDEDAIRSGFKSLNLVIDIVSYAILYFIIKKIITKNQN